MCSHLVRFGLSVALLSALGGPACARQVEPLGALTLTDTDGWTQVSIGVPAQTRYDVFSLAGPDRLVVDLHQARLPDDFRIPGPNGLVANVRTGQPVPGDVRLVFELGAKAHPKAAIAHDGGASRLVIRMRDPVARVAGRAGRVLPMVAEGNSGRAFAGASPTDATATGASRTDADAAVLPSPQPAMLPDAAVPATAKTNPDVSSVTSIPGTLAGRATGTNAVLPQAAGLRREAMGAPAGFVPAEAAAAAQRQTATLARPGDDLGTRMPLAGAVEPERADAPRPLAAPLIASSPAAAGDPSASAPAVPPPAGARTVRDVLGNRLRPLVIAVDAGHGGQDVGAKGYTGTYEKNITLATARELAREIDAVPGMKAVLTRDGDYFVPLAERYHIARQAKADLFISIHADADPTHTATGSSVWVLSERGVTSQAARWLADRENAADLVGGVKLSDKDDTLASVLLNLSQSATMKASEDAAERVHQALRDIGRTHKAHPEHANFVVLRSPDVPSMLVETAFITNPEEERHLNDPVYRSRLAHAVLSGVESYFINTPLPGTQFAALHPRGIRAVRIAAMDSARPADTAATTVAHESPPEADGVSATRTPVLLATADDGRSIHIVQRGESLRDIAEHFGVSLQRLRQINDLHGNQVRVGQRLRIPARSDNG